VGPNDKHSRCERGRQEHPVLDRDVVARLLRDDDRVDEPLDRDRRNQDEQCPSSLTDGQDRHRHEGDREDRREEFERPAQQLGDARPGGRALRREDLRADAPLQVSHVAPEERLETSPQNPKQVEPRPAGKLFAPEPERGAVKNLGVRDELRMPHLDVRSRVRPAHTGPRNGRPEKGDARDLCGDRESASG
jgi:hypothetical protein